MARYPDYQVEPTPNKPTSLGLAKFQQAKLEKEPNLPLSPSLEVWLTVQAQILEGKDRQMTRSSLTVYLRVLVEKFSPEQNTTQTIRLIHG